MSVVIAIIAVVAAFGVEIGRGALKGSARMATQEKLQIIQRALDDYAAQNGYLPCPARRDYTPDSTTFGQEIRSGTTGCPAAIASISYPAGAYIGMVPVRTLGLPDNYAADAWGNKIGYAVSSAHTNSIQSYANTDNGALTVNGGTVAGTNYAISTQKDGTPGAGATYVVLSYGPTANGAYPLNGTAVGAACSGSNLTDKENCDVDTLFYDTDYNEGNQVDTFFDDYVVWGTNAGSRSSVAGTLTKPACSSGCAPICATCSLSTNAPAAAQQRLCDKWVTSTSPCRATCVWAGYDSSSSRFYPCP
jgi:type II secretory pathway pseudopilin PulG